MTDDIKKQISKTSDRTKVFKLLQQMTQKLNQVEFRSTTANGEIWIDKGEKIFRATSEKSGDNGLMALMEMLSAPRVTFIVHPTPVEKPKTNVDAEVLLAELSTNEAAVIERIKSTLWPVHESNVETEAAIEPIVPSEPIFDPRQSDVLTEPVISPMAAEPESGSMSAVLETNYAPESRFEDQNDSKPEPALKSKLEAGRDGDPKSESGQATAEDINMLEQLVLKAAADQDAAKAGNDEPAPKRSDIVIEESKEDDGMLHKKRADMRAMEVFYSEEPQKFFEGGDEQVGQDDLFEQRRSEMAALNAMLEAHANLSREIFHEKEPEVPDNEREKRRREFEALREYFAENPERFYEYVTLGEDDPNGTEELRSKILKAMEATRDVEAFEATDGRVADESVLRHVYTPEPEAPEAEPEVDPKADAGEEDFTPVPVEPSPFADEASSLNYEDKHKGKLDVLPTGIHTDDLSLIKRDPNRENRFGFIDRDKLRHVERIPKHVLIAAAVFAALMPIIALYMYHYFNQNAQADYEDQRAASELAARAAYEESSSRKTQEPYRHAEATAPTPQTPAPVGNGNGGGSAGTVSDEELNTYRYAPPDHPPAPITRTQADRASRCLAQGEQYLTNGSTDAAVRVFAEGLLDCPQDSRLRIRLARAYMLMKDYGAAKDVLLSGLKTAATQQEFEAYLAILREFPRI